MKNVLWCHWAIYKLYWIRNAAAIRINTHHSSKIGSYPIDTNLYFQRLSVPHQLRALLPGKLQHSLQAAVHPLLKMDRIGFRMKLYDLLQVSAQYNNFEYPWNVRRQLGLGHC